MLIIIFLAEKMLVICIAFEHKQKQYIRIGIGRKKTSLNLSPPLKGE